MADLLLKGITGGKAWTDAIVTRNVLQARNPLSAIRVGRLVRQRLELMKPDLWRLVRDGSGSVATHAVLAAAVKHSPLLGDFLDLVVREQYRVFGKTLPKKLWEEYLQACRGRDPQMPQWSESTRKKLGSNVYQVLAQAGYIDNFRSLHLQGVHIAQQVIAYLERNHEEYVLRCIEVGS